jgi:GH24 family phage-related lysozyme (muramidase)
MSESEKEAAEEAGDAAGQQTEVPLNRAQRRALAAGKGKPGNNALNNSTLNAGINRATVPPAQRIQTRGAGRGK